jgi:HAD superfamily hydrolase (TIGR01509 family)
LVNNELKAVLLDIDGTLVDSNDAHARTWVEAFKRGGYEVPFEKVRSLIGMGADNLIPTAVGISKDTEKGKQLSKWWEEIFKEKYLPHIEAFPKVRELLQCMREGGLKLVAASSSKEDLLEKLLEITGASDLFQEDTSADDADNSKPDPDIIHAALEKAGLPPEEALMLGDSPYDIEAAGKAGVGLVALRCGGFSDEDLKGALAIYDDPADLLEHYDESPFASRARAAVGA